MEVLRGEAVGLSDTLADVLHDDIVRFVPEGLLETDDDVATDDTAEKEKNGEKEEPSLLSNGETATTPLPPPSIPDPEYITKLRTLSHVRARLEEVVKTFGEAMDWPLAPSETSITSASFISVSAPDTSLGSQVQEEKGKEAAKKIRENVVELLNSDGGKQAGVEAASQRVERLRALATLWRRTTEERPRNKFVDSLARIVDDRRRALENSQARSSSANRTDGGNRLTVEHQNRENEGGGGGGFLWNLQRLRDEIYLE